MKKVKAKFTVDNIDADADGKMVTLNAVYSNDGENKDYSDSTPYGHLDIRIDKSTAAVDFFELGQEYYLVFSKADESEG